MGLALRGEFAAARGRYLVMGDADDSYDFGAIPAFVAKLDEGADLVMGSRFRGGGSSLARCPPPTGISATRSLASSAAASSGFRSRTSTAGSAPFGKMPLTGWASGRRGWSLRARWLSRRRSSRPPDRRDSRDTQEGRPLALPPPQDVARRVAPPTLSLHLLAALALPRAGSLPDRTWRPAPRVALRWPADPLRRAARRARNARRSGHGPRRDPGRHLRCLREGLRDHRGAEKGFRVVTLETGLAAGAFFLLAGAALVFRVIGVWSGNEYQTLDYARTMRWMIPGVLLIILGAQAILSAFFLSILGLKRR